MAVLNPDTLDYLWRIEQGESEVLTIPVTDDGEPLTVTGWPVDAKITTNPGGPTLYAFPAELATSVGTDVLLRVPAAVSSVWTFSVGWFRVRITNPDSDPEEPKVHRILQGPVLVDRD